MVINVNDNYNKMIDLLKRQGARISYRNEYAVALLDEFDEFEDKEKYIGYNMATLTLVSGIKPRDILEKTFKGVEITRDIFDLFLSLTFVEHGDCPECGGWLEHTDDDCDEGDHRGEYYVTAIYDCPICGKRVREYDAEATREGRDMRETYNSLMH